MPIVPDIEYLKKLALMGAVNKTIKVSSNEFQKHTAASSKTAARKLKQLEEERLIDKIGGKKRVKKEYKVEPEKGMTTRENLYWGLKAFRSLRKPLFRLFSDLLRGIKIKNLDSRVIFGLSDPADTGILCGFIHSVAGLIYSRCTHCSFLIRPVFMDPMLDFRGNAEIRVKIYSMILPFVKFMFNKKTLSFTYSVIKEILQRKWESEWKSKWKSKWKFNS